MGETRGETPRPATNLGKRGGSVRIGGRFGAILQNTQTTFHTRSKRRSPETDDTHFRYMSLPSFSRFGRKKIIFNLPHSPTTKHTQSGAIIFFVYTKNESRVWLFSISRSKAALVGEFFSRALWDLERSRAILRKGTPPRAHLPCAVISIHLKGEAHP